MLQHSGVWPQFRITLTRVETKTFDLHPQQQIGEKRRRHMRLDKRRVEYGHLLQKLQAKWPDLYVGKEKLTLSADEVKRLIEDVCGEPGKQSFRWRHNNLVEGLQRGVSQLGWQLPIPHRITPLTTELSPVNPDAAARVHQYRALNKAFFAHLELGPDKARSTEAQKSEAGQLLFSFLIHSFCMSTARFQQLSAGIPKGVHRYNDLVWLDLENSETPLHDSASGHQWRIFPAPLTQLLLQRWYQRWGASWPTKGDTGDTVSATDLVRMYCREALDIPSAEGSFNVLAGVAKSYSCNRLHPIVTSYLSTATLGPSLPGVNWWRLLSGQQPKDTMPPESTSFESMPDPVVLQDNAKLSDQYAAFKTLGQLIRSSGSHNNEQNYRPKLIKRIDQFLLREDLSPLLQLLAAWAKHLLREGGVVKNKLAASSVDRYINWIGRPLVGWCADVDDPGSMTQEDWETLYQNCLQSSHAKSSAMANRLMEFHKFLELACDYPAVNMEGVQNERVTDARLLTLREYQQTRLLIRRSCPDKSLAALQELALILGYRCGLRRNEVWARQLEDFSGLDETDHNQRPEMLVRHNRFASLKSTSATRRVPLSLLLMDDEIALLRSTRKTRKDQNIGNANTKFLFSLSGLDNSPVALKRVFDPVTAALKAVTRDATFRFHLLRHSFMSLTFLRMMEVTPGEFIPARWRQNDDGDDLLPHLQQPLWQAARLPDPGKAPSLLSTWAGHVSPGESLRTYNHLMDWFSRVLLWQREDSKLNLLCQQALLQKSSAALEQFRHRKGLKGQPTPASELCRLMLRKWPKAMMHGAPQGRWGEPEMPDNVVAQVVHPYEHLLSAYELELEALRPKTRLSKELKGIEEAARIKGVPLAVALRWHANATYLMSMKSARERTKTAFRTFDAPAEYRYKLSTGTPEVGRSLAEKANNKRLPELPTFLSPPNTPITRVFADQWYKKLLEWHGVAPQKASIAMLTFMAYVQRTKVRVRVRGLANQLTYLQLLKAIGLKSYAQIRVRVLAGTDQDVSRKHWMDFFDLPKSAIRFEIEPDVSRKIAPLGHPQVQVKPPPKLNRNQNLLWVSLRFAVMSALVVTSDLSRPLKNLSGGEMGALNAGWHRATGWVTLPVPKGTADLAQAVWAPLADPPGGWP